MQDQPKQHISAQVLCNFPHFPKINNKKNPHNTKTTTIKKERKKGKEEENSTCWWCGDLCFITVENGYYDEKLKREE
jgi:hypothetical protein